MGSLLGRIWPTNAGCSVGAFELVSRYGPTPLAELTARLSQGPEEIARELNELSEKKMLKVTDQHGKIIKQVTPEQAAKEEQWMAALTFGSIWRAVGR